MDARNLKSLLGINIKKRKFSINFSNSNTKHQNRNNECKQHNKKRRKFHLNSLWSIWYGVLTTFLQGYLALHGAYRFVGELALN